MDNLIILAAGLFCLPLSGLGIYMVAELGNAVLENRRPRL